MSTDEKWQQAEWERERSAVRARLVGHGAPDAPWRVRAAEQAVRASGVVEAFRAHAERVIADMAHTTCLGDRENIPRCTLSVEAKCDKRKEGSCPKRIVEFEQRTARFSAGTRRSEEEVFTGFGIPPAIAYLVAQKRVKDTDAVVAVDAWWKEQERKRVLVLSGYSQIGKSVAAANLVARFGGRFISIPVNFVGEMREKNYIRQLLGVSLVVFDDLGMEKLDGFDDFKASFDAALCGRVDAGLWTVITTNSGSQLSAYGNRVVERIRKFGTVMEIANGEVSA